MHKHCPAPMNMTWPEVHANAVSTRLAEGGKVNETSLTCPVSDWSVWSPCDATCGVGSQTRVRLSMPPSNQFNSTACSKTQFIQLQTCTAATATCPTYVWTTTDGRVLTSNNGYTLTSPEVQGLVVAKCAFGKWRWSTSPCSPGYGTRVQVCFSCQLLGATSLKCGDCRLHVWALPCLLHNKFH